jgi:comEA protein
MFDLNRRERSILAVLLTTFLIGLCILAYQKSYKAPNIRIGKFNQRDAALLSMRKININSAGVEELASLKGIGNAIASRIVEYRDSHGSFASIEEIKKVKGLGPSLFDKIKDRITVE